ncbi:helix-turn-helix domain-containing protein [Nocardia callitridis]|uniref:HTH cro/C1-type domain-containing protein n=1 Tax=Nocardia callitridis TaxID=648753 RepID=A0ABP9KUF5_9NOCA
MKRRASARTVRAAREIGAYLNAWRKLLGLTAEEVAERAGVARSTYRRLETGELGVSMETYLNVLRVLGQLDQVVTAIDPYETDLGRARADQRLPERVRR